MCTKPDMIDYNQWKKFNRLKEDAFKEIHDYFNRLDDGYYTRFDNKNIEWGNNKIIWIYGLSDNGEYTWICTTKNSYIRIIRYTLYDILKLYEEGNLILKFEFLRNSVLNDIWRDCNRKE